MYVFGIASHRFVSFRFVRVFVFVSVSVSVSVSLEKICTCVYMHGSALQTSIGSDGRMGGWEWSGVERKSYS